MENINYVVVIKNKNNKLNSKNAAAFHKILGKNIFEYVWELGNEIGSAKKILVDETGSSVVKKNIKDENIICNDIVKSLDKNISDGENIFLVEGDKPLLTKEIVLDCISCHCKSENDITEIKSEDVYSVRTENIYVIKASTMKKILSKDEKDIFEMVREFIKNKEVNTFFVKGLKEIQSIESRIDLENATRDLKEKINNYHMENGVTIIDSNFTYISKDAIIGRDTIIYPNVIIEGKTIIGEEVFIGSNSKIIDSTIDDLVEIESSVIMNSKVGNSTTVGPFAYMRPNSIVGAHCKIGDFVEVKNSTIGDNTKASHLTYIGDSEIGNNINFGCGTVTVNYDGKNKFKTIVEDDVFIGCNTNLVAPVTVKKGAYIAAGSTITYEVPENSLAIARERQIIKENWVSKK